MSVKGKRTIWVGPLDGPNCKPLSVEGLAVDAITPGNILDRVPTGLQKLATAATVFGAETIVALEYGAHTDSTVDTVYEIGDNVLAGQARSGEFYNVLVADAQAVIVGAAMSSNGDGTLKLAVTDGTEQVLFYADEAITTSGVELVCMRKA